MAYTPLLKWDEVGNKFYETGVDHGVLYIYNSSTKAYDTGFAWNGLSSVSESPSGAESSAVYADNAKYLNLISAEEFGATIEAYTYPDEFAECDGSAEISTGVMIGQQSRKLFGLSYRTILGNDTDLDKHGYKIHVIYGCTASPSEKAYQTVNDSPEAISFSWEIKTTPVDVTGYKVTASLVIDSTKFTTSEQKTKLENLEKILYGTPADGGTAAVQPRLPLPNEIITLLS